MNTCDCCNLEMHPNNLIWISADGFQPLEGEELLESVYNEYAFLCNACYEYELNEFKKSIKESKLHLKYLNQEYESNLL